MRLFRKIASLLAVLAMLATATGCHQGDPLEEVMLRAGADGVRLSLVLGAPVPVFSQQVPVDGAAYIFDRLGDPLDGLALQVPAGSYDHPVTFDISYQPIAPESDLAGLEAISPLIVIDSGGEAASNAVILRIPVFLRINYYTAVFAYDESTGALEGLPVLIIDKNSVTVAAQRFSRLLVTEHRLSDLEHLDVDTGFTPGVDTWQIPNEGSYETPRGNSWGMSVSALWYYLNEPGRPGGEHLWGRYGSTLGADLDTPDYWQDDSHAVEVTTAIQRNYERARGGLRYDISYEIRRMRPGMVGLISARRTPDELTFYSLASALALTRQPQLLGISAAGKGSALTLIAYKIVGTTVYVADPNDDQTNPPVRTLRLSYRDFEPYRASENASERARGVERDYQVVSFLGRSSLTCWDNVEANWTQEASPTASEAYRLVAVKRDGAGQVTGEVDLDANSPLRTTQDRLEIRVISDNVPETRVSLVAAGALDDQANPLPLVAGENRVGVYVEGLATWVDADGQQQSDWRWLGFDWIVAIRE
jgi:hypothetical protein